MATDSSRGYGWWLTAAMQIWYRLGMEALRYPDSGQLLDDRSILRNAARFATAQRAYGAYSILSKPLDTLGDEILAFLAVNAFQAEMSSTGDVLGWLFVLREWRPGDINLYLLRLLDKVQVGRRGYTENDAKALLLTLDPARLRSLLHIPEDSGLEETGLPLDVRERINNSIPANLEALAQLVDYQQKVDRSRVVAFNKLKHFMLAVPTGIRGKNEVLIPKWGTFDENEKAVRLRTTVWIACSPENIRAMASRAIVAQAVLNSLLDIVLFLRFGEPYSPPSWAANALNLPGWREDLTAREV